MLFKKFIFEVWSLYEHKSIICSICMCISFQHLFCKRVVLMNLVKIKHSWTKDGLQCWLRWYLAFSLLKLRFCKPFITATYCGFTEIFHMVGAKSRHTTDLLKYCKFATSLYTTILWHFRDFKCGQQIDYYGNAYTLLPISYSLYDIVFMNE